MDIHFKPIEKKNLLQIISLLQQLNTETPKNLLEKRVLEMGDYQNYECVGAFDGEELIGICGLWYSVRHYIGKSVEPDHVIVSNNYRNKNIGTQFFNWIYEYTKSKGCEAIELNTYSGNRKSHKFYYNEGFEIYAFHFLKVLRDDKKFY